MRKLRRYLPTGSAPRALICSKKRLKSNGREASASASPLLVELPDCGDTPGTDGVGSWSVARLGVSGSFSHGLDGEPF